MDRKRGGIDHKRDGIDHKRDGIDHKRDGIDRMSKRRPPTRMLGLLGGAAAAALALLTAPALASAADSVYWTDFGGGGQFAHVTYGALTGGTSQALFSEPENSGTEGIALDPANGKVYWANQGTGEIKVGNLDGTGTPQTLYKEPAEANPEGLTLDRATGKLYWTDDGSGLIRAGGLGGEAEVAADTIYTEPTESAPVGIAVDPATGKLYWTDQSTGEVRVGSVNGESDVASETLYIEPTESAPVGIAVDPATGKLYWADDGSASIRAGGLGGEAEVAAETLYAEGPGAGVWGLALDPATGKLYWTDYQSGLIRVGATAGESKAPASTLFEEAPNDSPGFLALLGVPGTAGAPAISGSVALGQPLTCSEGGWAADAPEASFYSAPAAYAYQWLRQGVAVPGATSASFTPTAGGAYTCEVTAVNQAGATTQSSAAVNVPAPAPSTTIASPASGGVYPRGQVVATAFSCAEGAGGPGLASCNDSNGTATASGGQGRLDTSKLGAHTYTVTAVSKDGLTSSASISYKVIRRPCDPAACSRPKLKIASRKALVIGGKAKLKLACAATGKACKGTLTLTVKVKRRVRVHKGKHVKTVVRVKSVKIAHASYEIAPGKRQMISLHLSRKADKLLAHARHHRLKVRATATVKGGRAAHRNVSLISKGGAGAQAGPSASAML